MRHAAVLSIVLCLLLLAGCSGNSLARGIYEGIRVRNELQSSPPERFGRPETPDFQEYERRRKEQRTFGF